MICVLVCISVFLIICVLLYSYISEFLHLHICLFSREKMISTAGIWGGAIDCTTVAWLGLSRGISETCKKGGGSLPCRLLARRQLGGYHATLPCRGS